VPIERGIIGFGSIGAWHADATRKQAGFRLPSVYDITPIQRAAAERAGRTLMTLRNRLMKVNDGYAPGVAARD